MDVSLTNARMCVFLSITIEIDFIWLRRPARVPLFRLAVAKRCAGPPILTSAQHDLSEFWNYPLSV